MAKFLITGGVGFIGSNIAHRLVKNKHKVRVLDNFLTGKKENLTEIWNKVEVIKGDIRDKKLVNKTVKGVDFVLHQAALIYVRESLENPGETNEVNINGTLNLLEAAQKEKVKRLIFASSGGAIYDESTKLPFKESSPVLPQSPYGISKLTGEYYCRFFSKVRSLETVILRYFNVFGPQQNLDSPYAAVIPKFIRLMLAGKRPTIYGDGNQSRDFVYVDNVVEANLLACFVKDLDKRIFNIASGRQVTVNQLVEILNKLMVKNIKAKYGPAVKGEVRFSQADITLAKKHLGYSPKISFEEGLKETINWYH